MRFLRTLAALALFLPLTFVACDDDDSNNSVEPDEQQNKFFMLDENEVNAPKAGGVYTINYKANSEVSASSSVDWVVSEITPSSDTTGVISITIAEYEVKNEATDYDPRTSSLTVTSGDEQVTIQIYQAPENLLTPDEAVRVNSIDQEYRLDYEGLTDYKVKFTTNGEYVVDSPWWIYIKETPIRNLVEGSKTKYEVEVNVKVLPNYADESRLDSISFTLGDKHFACKFLQEKTGWEFNGVQRTASEVQQDMLMGWNLSKACTTDDDIDYYTGALTDWMIDSVAQYNINVIRIPVLPYDTSAVETNQFWINGVKSIASSVAAKGKYAIISLSDNGWILRRAAAKADTTQLYNLFINTWNEIATLFDEDDDHIIFEAYDNFDVAQFGSESISAMKRLNELFVQTVRRSGKNNYKRCLVIPFDAESGATIDMPQNDVTPDRLMVSCKFFRPTDYATEAASRKLWGTPFKTSNEEWSSYTEDMVKQYFSDLCAKLNKEAHGIPALISEFGAISHGSDALYVSSEAYYVNAVAVAAKNNGFKSIVWDDNTTGVGHFGVFNRKNRDSFTARNAYALGLAQAALGEDLNVDDEEEEAPAE